MADNTPAQPWTAWRSDEPRGDFHTSKDQATPTDGTWPGGQRQAKDQTEAETT